MQHILSGNSDHAQMLLEQYATAADVTFLQPMVPRHAFDIGHRGGCNLFVETLQCHLLPFQLSGHEVWQYVSSAAVVGPPAPNLFRQSLRQTILEPISRLNSRTSSVASSRRSCVCVRPPDLAHRRLQEEEEETAKPLPASVIAAAAPKQAKAARPAR